MRLCTGDRISLKPEVTKSQFELLLGHIYSIRIRISLGGYRGMNLLACVLVTLFSLAVGMGRICPMVCQRYLFIIAIGEFAVIAAAVF